jgi:hypothetical protein
VGPKVALLRYRWDTEDQMFVKVVAQTRTEGRQRAEKLERIVTDDVQPGAHPGEKGRRGGAQIGVRTSTGADLRTTRS